MSIWDQVEDSQRSHLLPTVKARSLHSTQGQQDAQGPPSSISCFRNDLLKDKTNLCPPGTRLPFNSLMLHYTAYAKTQGLK